MRKAIRGLKNTVMQFSPIELKVREATNNDRFLVSQAQLAEIARATNDYQDYGALFAMLWKRLTDLEHVMHVQKALIVVQYLLRHGAERFISDAKRRARDIAALQKYKHYDEQNQDDAKEARAYAKAVYALLMDDQLLAQERGKSARLAGEGRLSGMGYENGELDSHYGQAAYGQQTTAARSNGAGSRGNSRPGSRRNSFDGGEQQQQQRSQPSAAASAPRRSAAASGGALKSGVVRRRSVDEDPFENPVIPDVVTGPPVKPRVRVAADAAAAPGARKAASATTTAAAAAPAKSARAAAPAAQEEEGEEEDEEAQAKRLKKEKKRAKKEAERREAEAAAKRAQAQDFTAGGNVDLTSFAPEATQQSAGELDFLSGGPAAPAYRPDVPGEEQLSDLFASATLTDEQVSSPLHYHASGNPFRSPEPPQANDMEGGMYGGEGFQQQQPGNGHSGSMGYQLPTPTAKALSPTGGLVNLNDITAPRTDPSRSAVSVDAGVSMSMMRSIQPLGAPSNTATATPNNAHKRSNVPSSVPLTQQHPHAFQQQNGFLYGGPALGPPAQGGGYPHMGGGGYPSNQMMYPQQQQQMMMMGGMGGYGGGAAQPMLAIMPPGMAGQGMAPPMMHYGGGAAAPNPAGYGDTFTQMRQAPSKQSHQSGPIIFDVPSAQPQQQRQQQQHAQQGGPRAGGYNEPQYQSFYGQQNGATQHQFNF